VKRSVANWAVQRECKHKPMHFYWFRAAIKFYNGVFSPKRATLKQVLQADLKLSLKLRHVALLTSCAPCLRDERAASLLAGASYLLLRFHC